MYKTSRSSCLDGKMFLLIFFTFFLYSTTSQYIMSLWSEAFLVNRSHFLPRSFLCKWKKWNHFKVAVSELSSRLSIINFEQNWLYSTMKALMYRFNFTVFYRPGVYKEYKLTAIVFKYVTIFFVNYCLKHNLHSCWSASR